MDTKEKKIYLSEDQDLLDRFNNIDIYTSGAGLEKAKHIVSKIQIESVLRSRKTTVDLDQSNKRFTLAIIFIAVVQLLIALFQFGFDVASSPTTKSIIGGLSFMVVLVVMVYFFSKEFKNKFKDDVAAPEK